MDAARSLHQGVGMLSEPTTNPNTTGVIGYRAGAGHPQVDQRPVHLALEQLSTPTPRADTETPPPPDTDAADDDGEDDGDGDRDTA